MAQWVRNLVMLITLVVWATVVITSLNRGTVPDATTWGVPGAVYLCLNAASPRKNGNRSDKEDRSGH